MAKPDKRYDLSRYINNALTATQNGALSSAMDTDNDNYLFAQSVRDLEIEPLTEEQEKFPALVESHQKLCKWLTHAKNICEDVISIVSFSDSTDLMILPDDNAAPEVKMSLPQSLYLLGLMYQLRPFDILDRLHLAKISPAIWSKSNNKVYLENLEAIKQSKAEQLESIVMEQALNNPTANIERMFALKAWMPAYRDNAPTPAAPAVILRVTLEGVEIDTTAGRRVIDVTEDSN